MSVVWRLVVWDADGSNERSYEVGGVGLEGRIASLDSFEVFPGLGSWFGDCGVATWTADPRAIDIPPRALVQLRAVGADGILTTWWKGVVVQIGDSRGERLSAYRAVGLAHRLRETVVPYSVLPPWEAGATNTQHEPTHDLHDVAYGAVWRANVEGLLPAGFMWIGGMYGSAPLTGVLTGPRYPGLETFAALLDDAAALAPAFIVPAGGTHEDTHHGVTYTEGEVVPPVTWGVDRWGVLSWRRVPDLIERVLESDPRVRVEWGDVPSDEVVNVVRLAFAATDVNEVKRAEYGGEYLPPASKPLSVQYGSGLALPVGERSERLVWLDNPVDLMRPALLVTQAEAHNDWVNGAYALDGNPISFASYDGAAVDRAYGDRVTEAAGVAFRVEDLPFGTGEGEWPESPGVTRPGFVEIRYASDGATAIQVQATARALTNGVAGAISGVTSWWYDLESTNTDEEIVPRTVLLPIVQHAASPTDPTALLSAVVRVYFSTGLRIYRVRAWVVDDEIASAVAQGYEREARTHAAVVERLGLHEPVTVLEVEDLQGGVTSDRVQRIEYRITSQEGLATAYHLGTAHEPELETEGVILRRLIKRVQKERSP